MLKNEKLKKLKEELDETYERMNAILEANSLTRRNINLLPHEAFLKYQSLNLKSTALINEFSGLLSSQ